MKNRFRYFLAIVCLPLLFGSTAVHAKCKCGKPPKEIKTEMTGK